MKGLTAESCGLTAYQQLMGSRCHIIVRHKEKLMTQTQGSEKREVLEARMPEIQSTTGYHSVSSWPAVPCTVTREEEELG